MFDCQYICRYVEFKCVSRIMCRSNEGEQLVNVPCSRAQVFSSTAVSVIQKRLLMKFLQFAADYTQQPDKWTRECTLKTQAQRPNDSLHEIGMQFANFSSVYKNRSISFTGTLHQQIFINKYCWRWELPEMHYYFNKLMIDFCLKF